MLESIPGILKRSTNSGSGDKVESRSIEEDKVNPGPIEVCWNARAQLEIIWQKNLVPLAGELEQGEGTQYHLEE
jgi:hypothetical protein